MRGGGGGWWTGLGVRHGTGPWHKLRRCHLDQARQAGMTFRKPFRAVSVTLGKRARAASRRKRLRAIILPIAVLAGAAGVGGIVGVLSVPSASSAADASAEYVRDCSVTDGDTVRCGDERIRLLGIDAPELPGHCRTGRECAPGDPYASGDSLRDAMTGAVSIERVGTDRYGRTLAALKTDRGDLSCWQLEHKQAIYKANWDSGLRIARTCPRFAL